MKQLLFISGLLFMALQALAQNRITGKVLASDNEAIIYRIGVSYNDSIQNITGSFYESDFAFEIDSLCKAWVTIESEGYESIKIEKELQAGLNEIGEIILYKKAVELEEVVVKAEGPSISRDGGNYLIQNIHNSQIGQAGNFLDMLKFTPGVMVTNGTDITVLGEGKPVIYINGREVKNLEELRAYQSTNASSIEVIRQPDAQYDASVSCIIRITLRETYKDYMGLNVSNATEFKNRISNTTNLNYLVNKGIFSGMASLGYGRINEHAQDYSKSIITHTDGSIFENNGNSVSRNKGNLYNVFTGINLDLKQKGNIGVQYVGSFAKLGTTGHSLQDIWESDNIYNKENNTDHSSNISLHSLSLSYVHRAETGNTFSLIADYATKHTCSKQQTSENYLSVDNRINTSMNNDVRYDIYTITPTYKFKFAKNDNEQIGINSGYIRNTGDNYINQIPQLTSRQDYYFAPYYSYSQSWDKWSVNIGLRYEYEKIKTILKGENTLDMERAYSNFFPNVRLKYKASKHINLDLYYRRIASRPSFSDLDPTVNYEDEYNYSMGNPNLKPTFKDNIELNLNLYKVGLSLRYSQIKNMTQWVTQTQDGQSNILFMQPVNIRRSHEWRFTADYSWSKNWFRMYLAGALKKPYIKFPYLEETKINDRLSCELQTRFTFNLYKSLSFYTHISYTSREERGISLYAAKTVIDAGLSASFFKNRLYVAVDGSDFLRESVSPEWEKKYLNTYRWQKNEYDTRGVRFTLRWTFNNIQSKFMPRSGNMEQISRTM